MAEFVLLDTKAFDDFISAKDSILSKYDQLNKDYDTIVNELLANWDGYGASAFAKDIHKVKNNIVGIKEILKTMCDTLSDCRDIYGECDYSLGKANREAISKE